MTSPKYLSISELVELIEEPQKSVIVNILEDHSTLFQTSAGSSYNHQAWLGGYWDHVAECMNFAVELYAMICQMRQPEFSLSEALVVMFLHDIEKPWRYFFDSEGKLVINPEIPDKKARKDFRDRKLVEYGIKLNLRQQNAMSYVEGELDNYTSRMRVMWPLGAFCHMCDIASARLWPNFPLPNEDSWVGAVRVVSGKNSDYYSAYLNRECPNCASTEQEVLNYDMMWHDGDIHCINCGTFVRHFDAG